MSLLYLNWVLEPLTQKYQKTDLTAKCCLLQQKALSISKIQYDGQLRISTQNSLKFCTYAGREPLIIEPLILGDE